MIKINLLPKKDTKRSASRDAGVEISKESFIKLALPLSITLLLILAVFAYIEISKKQLKNEIERNKKTFIELQDKIEQVKNFESMNKEIETKTKLIENLKNKQQVPLIILVSVAKNLPDGVWLTELSFGMPDKSQSGRSSDKETEKLAEKNVITVKGFGFSNLNIVSFIESLKKVSEFTDINLVETLQAEYEKVPVYRFVLNFKIRD